MRSKNEGRISICQFSTFRWTLEEDVARYATHGFKSIGVWRRKIDDEASAIDLLFENKMSVSSVHWAGGFTGDGTTFSEAIEDAINAIEFARNVGGDCLIIHPGARNGHTTSHATRLFQSALDELTPVARDYEIQLALEPNLSYETNPWTFFDRFQDSLDILEGYDPKTLGLVLDLFDVGFDSTIFEAIEQFSDRISLVQIADRKLATNGLTDQNGLRLAPGQGDCQLSKWLNRLQQVGYVGKFEVEVHGNPAIDYYELLDHTHEYFNEQSISQLLTVSNAPAVQDADARIVPKHN